MPVTTIYVSTTKGGLDHILSGGMISTDFFLLFLFLVFSVIFYVFLFFLGSILFFVWFPLYLQVFLVTNLCWSEGAADPPTLPGT